MKNHWIGLPTELKKKNQEQFGGDFGSFQNGIFNKWYD